MPIVLIYRPGERVAEIRQQQDMFRARILAERWLARKTTETAETVCKASLVMYGPRTGGAYVALMELLGWHREPDVVRILKAAGPDYRDQLPNPKLEEKSVPNVSDPAT